MMGDFRFRPSTALCNLTLAVESGPYGVCCDNISCCCQCSCAAGLGGAYKWLVDQIGKVEVAENGHDVLCLLRLLEGAVCYAMLR